MFESIYITDASHALTYEYLVFPHAPAFSEVGGTISARLRDRNDTANQKILHIPLNLEYFVCTYSTSSIYIFILCLMSEKDTINNPLHPNVFLEKLVLAAEEYFGSPLAPTKLTAHSDTLTLLINEMIVNGLPHITEVNNLKDLVLLKSLLNTIIRTGNQLASAATNKTLASLSAGPLVPSSLESDEAPWRKSNVKYTNNEMFVDVVESVNAVFRPTRNKKKLKLLSKSNFDSAFYSTSPLSTSTKLTAISRYITGSIDFVSHISGVPQLQILLNSTVLSMDSISLHRCINLATWKANNALSFIPPDGKSTLLNYTIDLDKLYGKSSQNSMLGLLEFDCETGLGINHNEFEFRVLTLKDVAVSRIEQLKVEVFAFEPTTKDGDEGEEISFREYESEVNAISDIKASRVTDGDFLYKGKGIGEWTIKNLLSGSSCVLRAGIKTSNIQLGDVSIVSSKEDLIDVDEPKKVVKESLIPSHFMVSFLYKGLVPSGLRVENLKLVSAKGLGEAVKPYKGVKYITKTGDLTIRTR